MKNMIFILILIVIITVGVTVWFFSGFHAPAKFVQVRINDHIIRAEVADTMAKRAQGLSGRAGIGENEGMFFIFDTPGKDGFWMRGMKFPIDIIWVLGDRVVGFQKNTPMPSGFNLPMYYPPSAVDRVLEVNAGSVTSWGVEVGDMIQLVESRM